MITVEIPKKELLRQLPERVGYALLEYLDEMPDKFVFETLQAQTSSEILSDQFPELYKACSPLQWQLFCALYNRGEVTYPFLANALKLNPDKQLLPLSNIIQVHIKDLRSKLKRTKQLFEIVTIRGAKNHNNGRYKMMALK